MVWPGIHTWSSSLLLGNVLIGFGIQWHGMAYTCGLTVYCWAMRLQVLVYSGRTIDASYMQCGAIVRLQFGLFTRFVGQPHESAALKPGFAYTTPPPHLLPPAGTQPLPMQLPHRVETHFLPVAASHAALQVRMQACWLHACD